MLDLIRTCEKLILEPLGYSDALTYEFYGAELPRRVGLQCWGLVSREALPGRLQSSQFGNRTVSGLLH